MQRAAEANGLTPRSRPTARRSGSWRRGGCSTSPTTTSSAPPSPATTRRSRSSCRRPTTTATSSWAPTRACTACRARRTTPRTSWSTALCPIHHRPVELFKEENYFFKLSAFTAAAARLVRGQPRRGAARSPSATRRSGFIRQGLHDISITRTSITWGVPVPWDPAHVFYVWYDALINYATAVGYGDDPERFDSVVAGGPPPHRQGHPPVPLRLLAGDADGGRRAAARTGSTSTASCWSAARRCPRRRSTRSPRPTWSPTFGVDGFRYHFLRDQPFGPDGEFSYEGMVARYNADLANNLGNLLSRVATVVASKCGGIGPAPSPDSRLAARGRVGVRRRGRGLGTGRAERGARGHLAADPRDQRRARGRRAVEGRARAGGRRRARATPSRCCASSPSWPRRPCPGSCAEIWRRIGLPGAPAEQRLPGGRGVGRLPGRPAGRPRATPLFPRLDRAAMWTDSHCHVPYEGVGRRRHRRGPGRRRDPARSPSGPTPAQSAAAIETARAPRRGVGHGRAASPRRGATASSRSRACLAGRGPEVVAVGECGLDYHYDHSPRPVQRDGVRRPGRAGPAARAGPGHPHPGGVGRHLRDPGRRGGAGAHGVPLLHRRARTRPGGPRPRRLAVVQRDRDVQDGRRRPRPRRRCARSTGCWSRPTRPFLAPVPHRGRPNAPALVPVVGAAVAAARGGRGRGRGSVVGQRRTAVPSGRVTPAAEVGRHTSVPNLRDDQDGRGRLGRVTHSRSEIGRLLTVTASGPAGPWARTSWPTPTPSAASPGWPRSAPATGWSRSAPGWAR